MITKTRLNKDNIKNVTDSELDALVYNKAADRYLETFGEGFGTSENDSILKQLFACSVLDDEVKNGGFDQFFLNSPDLINDAIKGLTLIGAESHSELAHKAMYVHETSADSFKDRRNPNFNEIDKAYYLLTDISLLREIFVRKNIELFYD